MEAAKLEYPSINNDVQTPNETKSQNIRTSDKTLRSSLRWSARVSPQSQRGASPASFLVGPKTAEETTPSSVASLSGNPYQPAANEEGFFRPYLSNATKRGRRDTENGSVHITLTEPAAGDSGFSIEDVLKATGTSWKQIVIIISSAAAYGHFSVQTLVPSLATPSMWQDWSWLADHPVTYNTVFAAGAFARLAGSLILVSWIDVLGRRFMLILCLGLSSIAAVVSAAAPNFGVYCVFRVFTLLFTSALPSASTVYAVELVQTKSRALPAMVTQFIACLMVAGASLVAWGFDASSPYGPGWRWTNGVAVVPGVLVLLVLSLLWVESPRFLAACKNDPAAAWEILFNVCKGGQQGVRKALGVPCDDENFPPKEQFRGALHTDSFTADHGPWYQRGVRQTKRLLKNIWNLAGGRAYRRLTTGFAMIWALQSFSYWGLATYATVFYKDIGVNAFGTTTGSYLIQIPGQAIIYYLMNATWSGRLWSIRIFALLSLCAHFVLGFSLIGSWRSSPWLVTWSLLCFMFSAPVWAPIYAFTAECYPTTHRGTAMALHGAVAALSVVITTYIGSTSLDPNRAYVYPFVWGSLRFGLFLATWIFPKESEMNNQDLKDVEATATLAADTSRR